MAIANDIVSTKIYYKFGLWFWNCQFSIFDGNVTCSISYGIYISQLIRFARASRYVTDLNTGNKLLTQKLLKQYYRYHKLHKTFSKFYRWYHELISKFQVGLTLFRQGLSEPEFYGELVYKLKKIVGSNNFLAQYNKIILHYKNIGYNINVLQQTVCLVVNTITVGNFVSAFNCTPVGWPSDSMTVQTLRLIYWWDGRGLMLWLFVGPTWVNYWISFAPVFSFIYCWVLIFPLSPFYILIYMFWEMMHWYFRGPKCKPNIYVSWSTSELRVRLAQSLLLLWIFYLFFCLVVGMPLCAFV